MSFVVDSAVALSWCFEDECTPATKALLEQVGESGAVAPEHWLLEVLNGLMMAERRQRVDAAKLRQLADLLRDLPITLDSDPAIQIWGATRGGLTHDNIVYVTLFIRVIVTSVNRTSPDQWRRKTTAAKA